jgi:DNA-binding CsgD family transcriptional regulator
VPRLSERDFRGALSLILDAGEVAGPWPFPMPILESLRKLIPCDVVRYKDRSARGARVMFTAGEPRGEISPEVWEANRRYLHLDPLVRCERPRRLSEVVSLREWRRSPIYNEVDRPMGVEHVMRLWIDPAAPGDARLEFDRGDRDDDFDEHDVAILELLRPHVRQLWHRAASRREVTSSCAHALSPREREVVALVAQGLTNREIAHVLWISTGTVRKHLDNVYDKLGVRTRTAAAAKLLGRDV